MAIIKFRPLTNGQRHMTKLDYNEITASKPEKSLTSIIKKQGGRNNQGKITVRHQAGGAKRRYRIVDFKRNKDGVIGNVATIEYDPNRTANIALIHYVDGEKRYILCPQGLKVGDVIKSSDIPPYKIGNSMRLKKKTPCLVTSSCEDCSSPERICNVWTITEKSFPKARIKVVLINEDLGF